MENVTVVIFQEEAVLVLLARAIYRAGGPAGMLVRPVDQGEDQEGALPSCWQALVVGAAIQQNEVHLADAFAYLCQEEAERYSLCLTEQG